MLVLVLMFAAIKLSAQMTVSIGEQMHCENSNVLSPVNVSAFDDVAAFTFYISMDTLMVAYIEVLNPHTELSGGLIIANFVASASTLIITWQSLTAADIPEGKLFDLSIEYHSGMPELVFLSNCEIALSDFSVVQNVNYVNGQFIPAIVIVEQPQPVSIYEGEQAQFSIGLQTAGDQVFLWQQNDGSGWSDLYETAPYEGVNTPFLSIIVVPYSFNNFSYRCKVSFENCDGVSDPAVLTVSPLSVISYNNSGNEDFSVFPNPCLNIIKFEISEMKGVNRLQLLNLLGEVLIDESALSPSGNINLSNFDPGIYILQLTRNNSTRETVKVLKH